MNYKKSLAFTGILLITSILINNRPVYAQITSTPNDTGTIINQNNNTFDIQGGRQTGNNLFHSFDKFGLNQGEIVNFMTNPSIQNILGRVTGGDASVINGIIQVSGANSNLYLINPAGIIFGNHASLNLPAAFTATTANGIQFGDKWFNAFGANDYGNLIGNPGAFAFTQQGSILNSGNLSVNPGQSLTLTGGTVINIGTISASGGNITIAAIPGERLVKISQAGSLLSLELPIETKTAINPQAFTPLSLPQLLTGGKFNGATTVSASNGQVLLTGSEVTVADNPGTTVVSGNVNVSGQIGGNINILGDKVALVKATINANGINGGGNILIGGDYQGKGPLPNANEIYINRDSHISADAYQNGSGGKVIAWADKTNITNGKISARGGENTGDGGFIEISGKENLSFDGNVDIGANYGKNGLVLFDPSRVEIRNFTDGEIVGDTLSGNNRFFISDGQAEIRADSLSSRNFLISPSRVVELLQTGNVSIAAVNSLDIGNEINSSGNSRISNLSLTAPQINVLAPIILNGGDINFNASNLITLRQPFTPAILGQPEPNFINSSGGNITFNGSVILNSQYSNRFGNLITNINSSAINRKGNVTFNQTVNKNLGIDSQSLNINAADITFNNSIGDSQPIGLLDISGNNISIKDFNGFNISANAQGNIQLQPSTTLALNRLFLDADQDLIIKGQNINIPSFGRLFSDRNIRLEGNNITFGGSSQIRSFGNTDIQAQGNLTLDSISVEAQNFNAQSQGNITVINSTNFRNSGETTFQSQGNTLITNSTIISTENLRLSSNSNLTLSGNQLLGLNNIDLQANNQLRLLETDGISGRPSNTQALNNITINGIEGIEIQALTNPESVIRSGKDLTLASNNNITGNIRLASGGNFITQGSFSQPVLNTNGIISSNGNVSFGDYTGSSLKVEARGSIRGGNINITEAGRFAVSNNDPDINILNAGPSVVLRAGETNLRYSPDNPANTNVNGTAFTFPNGATPQNIASRESIEVGNIITAESPVSPNDALFFPTNSVVLSSKGGIRTGDINTGSGSVKLTSGGNIIVNTINTRIAGRGGGGLEVDAGGIFRAEGQFNFSFAGANGIIAADQPVSIVTFFNGISSGGGDINIRHRGTAFREEYQPGNIRDNESGTVARIFLAGGLDTGVYGSQQDVPLFGVNLPDSNRIQVVSDAPNVPQDFQAQTIDSACNNNSTNSKIAAQRNEAITPDRGVSSGQANCDIPTDDEQILKILGDSQSQGIDLKEALVMIFK
jgi:filamentous hemagglutinin family protein